MRTPPRRCTRPRLLHVLGPSLFTLYEHVLRHRRILIFTQPLVQVACFLCQAATDMCFKDQMNSVSDPMTGAQVLELPAVQGHAPR